MFLLEGKWQWQADLLGGIGPYYVNGLYLLRIKLTKNCFIRLDKGKKLNETKMNLTSGTNVIIFT